MREEEKITLTREGHENLLKEIEELRSKRAEISKNLKTARSFGDLSENSEYDEARNEQAKTEARILQLENTLKNFVIVDDEKLTNDMVQIGSIVNIKDLKSNETLKFRIVGSLETDPEEGKISYESPVGKALLEHKAGDIVKVETPNGGLAEYKILSIGS